MHHPRQQGLGVRVGSRNLGFEFLGFGRHTVENNLDLWPTNAFWSCRTVTQGLASELI